MPEAQTIADARIAEVRDSPSGRLQLLAAPYLVDARRAPYRRAAEAFMRWQVARGLLNAASDAAPGSPWWRTVNERLLRDQLEADARRASGDGEGHIPRAVRFWLDFLDQPHPAAWYRAHNASIADGYVEAAPLASAESPAERFFMNVALVRVLYAHALVGHPRLALGYLAPLGPLLGDPRRGMAGRFLALDRVLPARYPLTEEPDEYAAQEHALGRLLDLGIIWPRIERLYAWSAAVLEQPVLAGYVLPDGPAYARHDDEPNPWRRPRPLLAMRRVARA